MSTARLITLEGSEGAGKTTAMRAVCHELDQWGVQYITVREPGGQANAEKIRDLLLGADHLDAVTELLLMFAARNELVNKVIRPTLNDGVWVISDRYVDASYAYQGGGRGLDLALIEQLDRAVVGDTQPDLTLLLDLDPKLGFQRIAGRRHRDRIEQEKLAFFQRIRAAYLQRAQAHSTRMAVIDASVNQAAVDRQLRAELQQRRGQWL